MSVNNTVPVANTSLVFHYDVTNTKSYKGPSGTNVLNQITGNTDSNSYFSLTTGTQSVYIPGLKKTFPNATYIDLLNNYSGGSGQCCVQGMTYGTVLPVTASTVYTYAIVYKSMNGYTHPNFMYQYQYGPSGYLGEYGLFDTNYRTSLGDGWYSAWNTYTMGSGVNTTYTYFYNYDYTNAINRMWVAKAMLLAGNYSGGMNPDLWPDLSQNRTSSQNIYNMATNEALSSSAMGYGTTGLPNFNGNNYFKSTSNVSILSDMTLSAWIKPTYSAGPHKTVICTDPKYRCGAKLMSFKNSHRYGIWLGFGSSDYEALVSGNISDNVTKLLTATWNRDTGLAKVYLNGVLQQTFNTGISSHMSLNTGNVHVGTGYELDWGASNMFEGNIHSSSIYNRTLSEAEVLQLFNASKSKYGL
jgi:hypothetical protein